MKWVSRRAVPKAVATPLKEAAISAWNVEMLAAGGNDIVYDADNRSIHAMPKIARNINENEV